MTLQTYVKQSKLKDTVVNVWGKKGENFSSAICVVVFHDLSKMAAGVYQPEEAEDDKDLTDHLNMAACLYNCPLSED